MLLLMYARTNGWANSSDASDLRRHGAHCDITAMNWKAYFMGTYKVRITDDINAASFKMVYKFKITFALLCFHGIIRLVWGCCKVYNKWREFSILLLICSCHHVCFTFILLANEDQDSRYIVVIISNRINSTCFMTTLSPSSNWSCVYPCLVTKYPGSILFTLLYPCLVMKFPGCIQFTSLYHSLVIKFPVCILFTSFYPCLVMNFPWCILFIALFIYIYFRQIIEIDKIIKCRCLPRAQYKNSVMNYLVLHIYLCQWKTRFMFWFLYSSFLSAVWICTEDNPTSYTSATQLSITFQNNQSWNKSGNIS